METAKFHRIEAREVALTDSQGRARILLSAIESIPMITFRSLRTTAVPIILTFDDASGSRLLLSDPKHNRSVCLIADPENGLSMEMVDHAEGSEYSVIIPSHGSPKIVRKRRRFVVWALAPLLRLMDRLERKAADYMKDPEPATETGGDLAGGDDGED